MSVRALTWAFHQELLPSVKVVLLALADYADDEGCCFPAVGTLATKASVSCATAYRVLNILAEKDLVSRQARTRGNGSRTSNTYRLNLRRVDLTGEGGSVAPVIHPEPSVESPKKVAAARETSGEEDTSLVSRLLAVARMNRGASMADAATVRAWRESGLDFDNGIFPAVARVAERANYTPPSSLRYFNGAVKDAAEGVGLPAIERMTEQKEAEIKALILGGEYLNSHWLTPEKRREIEAQRAEKQGA